MKTIVSCPQGYPEVILHTLIGFREARDEPNHLPFIHMGKHLIRSIVSKGYSLGNVVLGAKSLYTGGRIYEVNKSTYLSRIR